MNQWKKLVCLVLAVCSLSVVGTAGAVETTEVPALSESQNTEIQPMASHIELDAAIRKTGLAWIQPRGYGSYRVWVENTTNRLMTVTITSSSSSDSHRYYVSANDSRTYVINDAVSGTHTISFDAGSESVSGTVRVRVSNEMLY